MAKDLIHNGDLIIKDGDWLVEESTQQHISHVLKAHPGAYKNAPWLGVGIDNYLNAPTTAKVIEQLEREIKLQLESDGAVDIKSSFPGNSLDQATISARYD